VGPIHFIVAIIAAIYAVIQGVSFVGTVIAITYDVVAVRGSISVHHVSTIASRVAFIAISLAIVLFCLRGRLGSFSK
jgi:hypothetical protein